jgi:cell division protein FtsQ
MSRWRRKSKGAESGSGGADAEREFTDVKVVKREPAPSEAEAEAEAGAADESERDETDDGVLAELSMAFGDDDTKPIAAPDAALTTIALGGDDDLPDAVYLDEELGGGDDSEPVFIDDDGTGDALLAKDATGPGIEPRLRQRRIGVRRAEGRRRLRRWGVVAAVLVVVIAVLAVLGSSLFSVDDVDVTGVQRADADAVLAVVDDLVGEPVLLVDTGAAEDRLEQIPYVDTARVRTDFPNGVTIEVREREPVATAAGADGRFRILDHEGRVVDVINGQPIAFVLVSGPTTLDLEAGQYADTGYAAAAAMVTKLTPEVRSRMISMSVVPDGTDLRFLLSNEPGLDIEVRLGAAITDNDQIERLVRLQRVLDDVAGSDTTVIDVSTAETTER